MQIFKKHWQTVTIAVLIVSYLALVVFMKEPLSTWLLFAGGWFLLLILLFLGTVIGIVGVLIQSLTKRQDLAIPLYKTAYKLGTQNATILTTYGLILLRQHQSEEALACFDKALANTTYFLSAKTLKCNRAIALWKLDRLDEAIAAYNGVLRDYGKEEQKFFTSPTLDEDGIKAIVEDNNYLYPQDFTTLGFLYTLAKDYDRALFFSKAALEKEENFAAAYDNLGQIAYYQGDMTEAKVQFEKALEINPNLPDSLYFSGLVAFAQKDADRARSFLNQARQCALDGLNTVSYEMIDGALASLEKR